MSWWPLTENLESIDQYGDTCGVISAFGGPTLWLIASSALCRYLPYQVPAPLALVLATDATLVTGATSCTGSRCQVIRHVIRRSAPAQSGKVATDTPVLRRAAQCSARDGAYGQVGVHVCTWQCIWGRACARGVTRIAAGLLTPNLGAVGPPDTRACGSFSV